MSKKRNILIIEPPKYCTSSEHITFKGYECGYCHGAGPLVYDERCGDDVVKICPVCKGKGKIDAVIDITWRPSENL